MWPRKLLPYHVKNFNHLPYLGPLLDAGMAALFAEEIFEAIRYVDDPDFYCVEDCDVENGKIWLGAADDTIMRKRGVEFVDGSAPGLRPSWARLPDVETAKLIVEEYQRRNLYVFMAPTSPAPPFTEQLIEAGVQIGWNTRLVPFGPDISAAVFALGFANRAAMAFGGVKPGDYKRSCTTTKTACSHSSTRWAK
jgi:acetyl-CoA synthase